MSVNVRIRNGLCPDPTTGDGGATEGDIRGSFSDIIDVVGVKDLAGGHALVTQNSPAALSVLVAPGVVYIPNADYDELDSNQVKFWEAVITVSTAVAITANTSGSTRIDLICVKMDTAVTPDEHASNIATLVAVTGTPGAGVPVTPDNYAKLAEIEVANGALTIVTADITDSRVQSTINSDYISVTVEVTPTSITTFTGKTFDDELRLKQIATPADPATGYNKLYFKSDGKLYYLDENSVETEVGAGGGGDSYSLLPRQALINGNFDVWQRNITFTTPNDDTYGPDRWNLLMDGNGAWTFSRSTVDTDFMPNSTYELKAVNVTANKQCAIVQILESVDAMKLSNKDLTISFRARTTTGKVISNLRTTLLSWEGTADSVTSDVIGTWAGGGTIPTWATNWVQFDSTTPTLMALTTSSQEFSFTVGLGPMLFENLALVIWVDDTTITAGNEFYIGQVQLCAGDVALPFMPKSYDEELRACRRYFYKIGSDSAATYYATGMCNTTTVGVFVINFPVEMRIAPTSVETTGTATNYKIVTSGDTNNVLNAVPDLITAALATKNSMLVRATVASGLTAGQACLLGNNAVNAYLAFSAEL